jgi:hypothetical protein
MKKFFLLSILCVYGLFIHAQVPQAFKYQGVARNSTGNVLSNQPLTVRLSFHDLTPTGTIVYQETHAVTTNSFGLFNVDAGQGSVTGGTFTAINWATGNKYLEQEVDFGTGFLNMGTSQLLSVPYALYAASGNPGPAGSPGANGLNTLVKTTAEPSGTNCATGGTKQEYGFDVNTNNILDAPEVNASLTQYICNGAAGSTGPAGPSWSITSSGFNANGTQSLVTSIPSTITTGNGAWTTTGNSGSTGTNFIGTTDNQAFVVKTNGTSGTNERMRFLNTPQVLINSTTAQSGDLFAVYGTGYAGAINSAANQTDFPIAGYSTASFAGIYGENTGGGQGLLGINTSTGVGVYGQSANANGIGLVGQNTTNGTGIFGTSAGGYGAIGLTNTTSATGIRGANQHATGTGIVGLGNNVTAVGLYNQGSGVAGFGTLAGGYFLATNTATGSGIIGSGNNVTALNTTGFGEGVNGNATSYGVAGFAVAPLSNDRWGGYFDYINSANGYGWICGRTGGVDYGIASAGVKSTIVKDDNNQSRIMYCTESPEVLFEDYGFGQLTNGFAHIEMDKIFAKNISADRPIRVFIQLEGDCNGVYVTNKSVNGFDVKELTGGTSNVKFSWHLIGNRADTKDESGNITNSFSTQRFPLGPVRAKKATAENTNELKETGSFTAPAKRNKTSVK